MRTRLKALEKIDKYLEYLITEWATLSYSYYGYAAKNAKDPLILFGSVIKILYFLTTEKFFDANALENHPVEKSFNTELLVADFFDLCPNDAYKEFLLFQTQLNSTTGLSNLKEKDCKEEKNTTELVQKINKKIHSIIQVIKPNQIQCLHSKTLNRLAYILPKQDLLALAKSLTKQLATRAISKEKCVDLHFFMQKIAAAATTFEELIEIMDTPNITLFQPIADRATQLIKEPKDLENLIKLDRENSFLFHNIKLSSTVINTTSKAINSFEDFLIFAKKMPFATSFLLNTPVFSYRVFIELNLSSEQFFQYLAFSPPRINFLLSRTLPAVTQKILSYIQDVKTYKELVTIRLRPALTIFDDPQTAVSFFNRIFAKNIPAFWDLLVENYIFSSTLCFALKNDIIRNIAIQGITTSHLMLHLDSTICETFGNTHKSFLAYCNEEETTLITKKIYPNITVFLNHLQDLKNGRSPRMSIMWSFLFEKPQPQQYLASLFNSAEQLAEFSQMYSMTSPHPAQTLASIIFKAFPPQFFLSTPAKDYEILMDTFPQHRTEIVAEKIQEAIPDAIRITKTIIANYLFFAPLKSVKPLDLDIKESIPTHALTKLNSYGSNTK